MESELKIEIPQSTSAFGSTDFVRYSRLSVCLLISGFSMLTTAWTIQGDVTYELPGLHPMFAIPVGPGEGNHTEYVHLSSILFPLTDYISVIRGFAKAARTKEAHQNTIQVAKGLAAVGWRILTDENFAKAAKKE